MNTLEYNGKKEK